MMREGVSKETFGTLSFCFIRLAMPKILNATGTGE